MAEYIKPYNRISVGKKRAVFLGSKELGLNVLKCLYASDPDVVWTVIHPEDSGDGRSALTDFQRFSRLVDIDLLVVSSGSASKQILYEFGFDIAFVCGWYFLLDSETVSRFPYGIWGIHNSLLPKYRGSSPLVWSIIKGDDKVGSSVFQLVDGIDTGAILLQIDVENKVDDDVKSLLTQIQDRLLAALPACWNALLNGSAKLVEQDESKATYCGYRTERDGVIDWNKTAVEVHNFVRAQSPPYPGAFSYLDQKKVRILRTIPTDLIYDGSPGQVLRKNSSSVLISCGGRTAIEVLEVAVEGVLSTPRSIINSLSQRFGT